MTAETDALLSIEDFIRWGASRFSAAGLHFGHGTDNPSDEAAWLVAHALHLPPAGIVDYRTCRVTARERALITELLARRITERRPAAYLTGQTWFADLPFLVDEAVMVPRSPLAELIVAGFSPWLAPEQIGRVLDLCTGSGCIGIATAVHLPAALVDLADISPAALQVARRNRALHAPAHDLDARVRIIQSDLFAGLDEQTYDLIVANPPYVSAAEIDAFPAEYRHEPRLAFAAGVSGLDLVLRILRDAPDFLDEAGVLICEVGNSAAALIERFDEVPFTWLDFEHGGDGVFLLHQPELVEWHAQFAAAVAALD